MPLFISKKQRKLIRDRRKKKRLAEQGKLVVRNDGIVSIRTKTTAATAAAVATASTTTERTEQLRITTNESRKEDSIMASKSTVSNQPAVKINTTTSNVERSHKATTAVGKSNNSKKRSLTQQSQDECNHADEKASTFAPQNGRTVIVIPMDLSSKDARKFRKDTRRQARVEGEDENMIEFIMEGQESKTIPPDNNKVGDNEHPGPARKKVKKEIPRINELIQQEKKRQEHEERMKAIRQEDLLLSEEYKSRYVALDCEMVGVGEKGMKSVLARVSLVDWHGQVLLDTFVHVPSRVTDFRTWVSGVKPKHLKGIHAMDPTICRHKVSALLKNKILVGHALRNDLEALMLQHPKADIRDTARYRPFQRFQPKQNGGSGGKWQPRKLRDLVLEHLHRAIQLEGHAHDSVTDAQSAMELFQTVRAAWEQDLTLRAQKKTNNRRSVPSSNHHHTNVKASTTVQARA